MKTLVKESGRARCGDLCVWRGEMQQPAHIGRTIDITFEIDKRKRAAQRRSLCVE
jgi:hypothetical protein